MCIRDSLWLRTFKSFSDTGVCSELQTGRPQLKSRRILRKVLFTAFKISFFAVEDLEGFFRPRTVENHQEPSRTITNCQAKSRTAKNSQKRLEKTHNNQEQPKTAKSGQERAKSIKSSHEQSKTVKNTREQSIIYKHSQKVMQII